MSQPQDPWSSSQQPAPQRPPRPSYALTIVVTLLLGPFGAIAAASGKAKAEHWGYPGKGYWTAFWVTLIAPFAAVIAIALVVVTTASVSSNDLQNAAGTDKATAPLSSSAPPAPPEDPTPSDVIANRNGCLSDPGASATNEQVFAAKWSQYRAAVDKHNIACGNEFWGSLDPTGGTALLTPRSEVIQPFGDAQQTGSALAQIPGTVETTQPTFRTLHDPDTTRETVADYTCRQPDGETFRQEILFEYSKDGSAWSAEVAFASKPSP